MLRFLGHPQFLVVVAARKFISKELRDNYAAIGIELLKKETEAHWSFGACERKNAVFRETFEKVCIDSYVANWGKDGLLVIFTHFVNSAVRETNKSAYLLVFGKQPRFLSPVSPQAEQFTNGERQVVMNVARSVAETDHCRMRYLEFKKRSRPTDVVALQTGSLCYVYREKSQVSLCSGKVGGFYGPHIYLDRRCSVAYVKIGRRLHKAPTSYVKPAPAAEDILASSPTAIEDGQLLATKPPLPPRLRGEIDEDMLFPYHATFDQYSKLGGVLEYNLHPLGNSAIRDCLSETLEISGPFCDARSIYVNENPNDQGCAKKSYPAIDRPATTSQYSTKISERQSRYTYGL